MNIRNGVGDIVRSWEPGHPAQRRHLGRHDRRQRRLLGGRRRLPSTPRDRWFRDRVTNIVTSISNGADEISGGYRSNNFGYGIAQVTAAQEPHRRRAAECLKIDHTRVVAYNKIGILIDASTGINANGETGPVRRRQQRRHVATR